MCDRIKSGRGNDVAWKGLPLSSRIQSRGIVDYLWDRREVATAHRNRRNRDKSRRRHYLPLTFIVEKEEGLVFTDGTSCRCAKLIEVKRRYIPSVEEVAGISLRVLEIFVDASVQAVSA